MNPNILITGTPGTGKSTLSELVLESTGLNYINVNEIVKEKGLHEGFDQEFQSYILDDDKVINISQIFIYVFIPFTYNFVCRL